MNYNKLDNNVIWIIGASTGIGAALARELDREVYNAGALILSSRRKNELDNIKSSLKGVGHQTMPLDITNLEEVIQTAQAIIQKFGKIDRVILLAADYTPMTIDNLNSEITKRIIDINLLGSFYVINAVVPILKKQSFGQISLCGSVAGYFGLPGGQPYSATKAGIINLAESLRSELPETIDVKLINPGFVKTNLTDKNNFPMPMILSTEQAAKLITKGLLKRGFEIHFPKGFTLFLKILSLLPYKISLKLAKKISQKKI